ncbi:hypothetical protein DI272_24600 [Streptomyces sp. Act143]|uniref:hypothetical protein n=1 Tax=Streptomyces sp. Act143 TaxID=2200760 RepID=UPI000D6770E7|nr:hypothetical protein [Streptomyces sp. Act143]PWI16988.1 hypothetical protein DI272_24600 [Streptomyces sp. Act143]
MRRPPALALFGTGYLATRVTRAGDGFLWSRTAGPDRPEDFTPVPAALARAARAARGWAVGGTRVVLGAEERVRAEDYGPLPIRGAGVVERRYPAPAPYSLGHVLGNRAAAPAHWAALPRLLERVGEVLRQVHTSFADVPVAGGPAGPRRLAHWLAGRQNIGRATRLWQEAHRVLGPERMAVAASWCTDPGASTAPPVLLLGGTGLGSQVPTPDAADCVLLTGEELAAGPASHDLGWIVGELAEFRLLHFTGSAEDAAAHCASATAALLRGYAGGPGPRPASAGLDAVARSAVLRMFTHCLDYAAFVGWDDRFPDHLDVLAALLDHPMGTIDGLTGAPVAPDVALETEES